MIPLMKHDHKPKEILDWHGLKIEVEYPVGSYKVWRHQYEIGITKYKYPYGYIHDTEAVDGDSVDCFMGPDKGAEYVYIIKQMKPDSGKYDEPKCMLDFKDSEHAKQAYLMHMSNDPRFFGGITRYSIEHFIKCCRESNRDPNLIKSKLVEA